VIERPERALWSTVSVRFAVLSLLDFFTIAGFAVPFALSSDPRGLLTQNCQPTHVGNRSEQY